MRTVKFIIKILLITVIFCSSSFVFGQELIEQFQKAEDLYNSKSYYFSYREFEKALTLADNDADKSLITLKMGMCQYKLENYGLAADEFDKVISEYDPNAYTDNALYFSALTYFKLGNHPTTASRLLRVLRYERRSPYYKKALKGLKNLFRTGLTTEQITWVLKTSTPNRVNGEHLFELAKDMKDDYPDKSMIILFVLSKDYRKYDFVKNVDELLDELRKKIKPINTHIGVLIPTSGSYKEYGEQIWRGVKLAIEDFNSQNDEIQFKAFVEDEEENPEQTLESFIKLANTNRVAGVIGPLFTDILTSLEDEAERLNIPVISPAAGSGELPESSYLYRCTLTNRVQAETIAEYALKVLNLDKFAILYPDTAYGKEMRDYFKNYVENNGGRISAEVDYPLIDPEKKYGDYTGVVKKVKYSRPEGIFIPGHYDELVLIVPQIAYAHIPAILLGTSGWDEERVARMGGKYFEGSYFISPFYSEDDDPLLRRFVVDYYKEYGEEPGFLSAQAYDATTILIKSLIKSSENSKTLNEILNGVVDYRGVSGKISLKNKNGECEKTALIMTIREQEKIPVTDE
jgi:branched-chain amino acid transport system substrate-binding protein